MKTTLLDEITNATHAAVVGGDDKGKATAARIRTLRDVPPLESLVPGEEDRTTFTALAELYDSKRDKAVACLSGVVQAYAADCEKRGTGMTAAVAAPMLAEMRKYLDAADAAQERAATHRRAT